MKMEVTITSGEEVVGLRLHDDNNVMQAKSLLVKDFISLLTGCKEKGVDAFRLGQLPIGFVDCKFADPQNFTVVVKIEGCMRKIVYSASRSAEGKEYKIPFPTTIFCFAVENGRFRSEDSTCFAVNKKEEICCYPFGNVWSGGGICWGANKFPQIQALKDINVVTTMFFDAGTNSDLYRSDFTTGKYESLTQLYKELEKQKTFPDKLLVKTGDTLDTFLKKCLG